MWFMFIVVLTPKCFIIQSARRHSFATAKVVIFFDICKRVRVFLQIE